MGSIQGISVCIQMLAQIYNQTRYDVDNELLLQEDTAIELDETKPRRAVIRLYICSLKLLIEGISRSDNKVVEIEKTLISY